VKTIFRRKNAGRQFSFLSANSKQVLPLTPSLPSLLLYPVPAYERLFFPREQFDSLAGAAEEVHQEPSLPLFFLSLPPSWPTTLHSPTHVFGNAKRALFTRQVPRPVNQAVGSESLLTLLLYPSPAQAAVWSLPFYKYASGRGTSIPSLPPIRFLFPPGRSADVTLPTFLILLFPSPFFFPSPFSRHIADRPRWPLFLAGK